MTSSRPRGSWTGSLFRFSHNLVLYPPNVLGLVILSYTLAEITPYYQLR